MQERVSGARIWVLAIILSGQVSWLYRKRSLELDLVIQGRPGILRKVPKTGNHDCRPAIMIAVPGTDFTGIGGDVINLVIPDLL